MHAPIYFLFYTRLRGNERAERGEGGRGKGDEEETRKTDKDRTRARGDVADRVKMQILDATARSNIPNCFFAFFFFFHFGGGFLTNDVDDISNDSTGFVVFSEFCSESDSFSQYSSI